MKIVAKISTRSGQLVRTVALGKGAHVLVADKDALVTIIDEATGKPVEGAHYVRHGDEVTVQLPATYLAEAGNGLGEAGAAQDAAAPAPAASESAGGGHGLLYGVLGGLAVAGGVAAAAGGGGKAKDKTPPAAPTGLALAAADDTGSSSSDRITKQTSALTITGTAEAGASVTLHDGSTTLGTATAGSNGAFSIDVSLSEGAHSITASATDAAGNAGTASSALSITVDTTAPTVAISAAPAALLAGQTATVTFSFSEAPAGFDAGDISVSGGTISNLAVSAGNANVYTATLTPTATSAGNLSISVAGAAFTDIAGNASTAAASLNVAFDPGASGAAIDGYIANALVFRDADNDGVWDHESFTDSNNNGLRDAGEAFVDANGDGQFTAEYHTTTDAQGNFSGLFGTGQIVLTPLIAGDGTNLSRDISTGIAFTGQMSAPDGSSVVTPLTTIVAALAGAGASAAQIASAEAQVKAALGLDAALDLGSYDPIAVVAASTDAAALANAVAVQKAAIQVANILSVMASASEAAGSSAGAGVNAAVSAIAGQVAAGGSVDLTSSATVTQIVQTAAGSSSAVAAQASAIGSSLASVNASVAQASGANAIDTLAAVATSQIVAQETLAGDVSGAISGGTALSSSAYQGAALAEKIDDAATQVQVIVPTTPTPGALGAPDRPVVDDGVRISAAEASDGVVVSVGLGTGSGVAAGDTLRLMIGGTEVKAITLSAGDIAGGTASIALSTSDLGADGAKSITAGFVSAAGVSGAVSLPAVVTLDTVAPAAPAGLALSEGPVLTGLEGANGTTLSGSVEAGSSVAVTLTNGSVTIVKQADVVGAAFTLALSAAEVAQLGEGAVRYSAVATDAAGNSSAPSLTGQYFYTTQAIVDPNTRIDGVDAPISGDDEDNVLRLTPLSGGGFAVNWVVDGGGEADGLAIQRFAADGAKQGGIILLQGISQQLVDSENDEQAFDLQALANGGYALTYTLELEDVGRSVTFNPQLTSTTIVGLPTDIYVGGAPANAVFALVGLGNDGLGKTVTLTAVNGSIAISQAILDQFAIDNRLTLTVSGLTTGQTANISINAQENWHYDPAATLDQLSVSRTVTNGVGVIATPMGHPESFHIDAASGAPSFVNMQITPNGGSAIDLSGVTGAIQLANGAIQFNGVTADANGLYHVPQALLDQLAGHDYQAILIVGGLASGSTLTGTIAVREPVTAPEGVFVQTFDAQGLSVSESARLDGAESRFYGDSEDNGVRVTPLSGGGFAVNWVVDADHDDQGDGFAVQRFAADGSKVGGVVLLQGIAQQLIDNAEREDVTFDLQALDNGGYVLAYSLQHPEVGQYPVFSQTLTAVSIIGEPNAIYLSGGTAPANAVFALVGQGMDGLSRTVTLTPANGVIEISQAILDQFAIDHRLTFTVTGLTSGQTVPVSINAEEIQEYDPTAALMQQTASRLVGANGAGIVVVPTLHAESFHIDAASGTPTSVSLQIMPSGGAFVDLTGIANATRLPTGAILISGVTADAGGNYAVPQAVLSQLVGHDYQAILIANGLTAGSTITGTVSARTPHLLPEGLFVQTFDANGVSGVNTLQRLDGVDSRISGDDEDHAMRVTPLTGGGFAVSWVVDVDGDDQADGLAVQRFAADGSMQGGVVHLQGIASQLTDADGDAIAFDLQALDNGGYALSYALAQEEVSRVVTFNPQLSSTAIVGEPVNLYVGSAPANASFALVGQGTDGAQKIVSLSATGGVIGIDQTILDQFALDNRLTLTVSGLTAGQTATAYVTALEDQRYDPASALHSVASSLQVGPAGFGVIATGTGHAEAFHIDSTSNAPTTVFLQVTPNGAVSIDLSSIANASTLSTGAINIMGLTPDAEGNYHVPQALLDQLAGHDYQAILIVGGLTAGSTITGTISARDPVDVPEGVFVQTFDAQGAALSSGLHLTGTAGGDLLIGDIGNDVLDGGAGTDTLTGGAGADLFILEAPHGQTLSAADLITDFHTGVDHLQLPGSVTFASLQIVQGDPATNGAAGSESLIIDSGSGDILARLANVDAAAITQASFA